MGNSNVFPTGDESDLLFAVQRKAGGEPAWLYVLLEHQPTPDRWLRLRLLKYSIRIRERDRSRHRNEKRPRPIVPVVLYQGGRRWRYARELSALFGAEVREWPGVPHYAHLSVDQTKAGPEELRGELHGRIAQLAMMAAYRRAGRRCSGWCPCWRSWGRRAGTTTWSRSWCTLRRRCGPSRA